MIRKFFGMDLVTLLLVLLVVAFVCVPGYFYMHAMFTGSDL